uniref:Uncharacterized protein n=1 Tax=Photinus pyralis TaxID=7054 RepID=A0A1Y1LSV7_PHOPY
MALVRAGRRSNSPIRGQQDSIRNPEATIRGQSSSTKGISAGNFPHASQKLHQAAISKRQGNNNIRLLDTASVGVDSRENESSQGESRETKRSWVSEFAVFVRLPQPRVQ